MALVVLGSPAVAVQPPGPAPAKVTPKVGMFTVSMTSSFTSIPRQLQIMNFWFPMPFEDAHQKIYQRVIAGPYTVQTVESPDHTAAFTYMEGAPRGGLPLYHRITFYLERTEDLPPDLSKVLDKPATEEEKAIHERWLKPDTLVVVDKEMKSIASKIVKGKKSTVDRARAIYDYLVANMKAVDPSTLPGAGLGNAKFTVKEMKGDDIDLPSAFVGLCRALEIPARNVIGLKFPPLDTQGSLNDSHGWAQFYVDGVGWVPVDPSEARRNPARRAYYFGALDERRMAISIGRDITLIPPQEGPPLNFWVKPYWEGDAKPMPDPYVEFTFSEVTDIPGRPPAPPTTTSKPETESPRASSDPPASAALLNPPL